MIIIRPIQLSDIPRVTAIGDAGYEDFLGESGDALWGKACHGPSLSLVYEEDNLIKGYLISYPAAASHISVLNHPTEPGIAESWYLHDLCVATDCRKQGIGPAIYHAACKQAQTLGLKQSHLVAVQGAHVFWAKLGYQDYRPVDSPEFREYGPLAHAMKKTIL